MMIPTVDGRGLTLERACRRVAGVLPFHDGGSA